MIKMDNVMSKKQIERLKTIAEEFRKILTRLDDIIAKEEESNIETP